VACGWWLVAGGWWLVAGGWWLVAGGWWLGRSQWEVRDELGSGTAIIFAKPHVVSRRGALATSH
jgi:hypothetical protein